MDDEKEVKQVKSYWKGFISGILLMTAVFAGIMGGLYLYNKDTVLANWQYIYKLGFIEKLINQYYYEEKEEDKLAEGMYQGLVYGLGDVYSCYYTAEEYESKSQDQDGEYQGIGIVMSKTEDGGILVEDCYEESPAEQAGFQKNDVIQEINGTSIKKKSLTEVSQMVKTAEKEEIDFLLSRGEENIHVKVTLGEVEMQTVHYEMKNHKIGYLSISEFKGNTYKQYQTAIENLQKEGMEKLVIDLRNNPGGLLTSVCDILREILPEGLIVYTEDKYGNREEEYCDGKHPLEIPLVVLVNGESASASEIFAGAVKDYGIGTLVGETTYGKGIVQNIRKLSDGSAIKLTESKYYTPSGNNIHKVGIEPDFWVEESENEDEDWPLRKAMEILMEE